MPAQHLSTRKMPHHGHHDQHAQKRRCHLSNSWRRCWPRLWSNATKLYKDWYWDEATIVHKILSLVRLRWPVVAGILSDKKKCLELGATSANQRSANQYPYYNHRRASVRTQYCNIWCNSISPIHCSNQSVAWMRAFTREKPKSQNQSRPVLGL